MSFTTNVYTDIFTFCAVAIVSLIMYFKWTYKYWERLGVPYIKPTIPFGTVSVVGREALGNTIKRQYKEAKATGHKYVGLFGFVIPQLMIIDPVLIKTMLIKDFNHFTDHGVYVNEELEPLSAHLFGLQGLKWKNLRAKLSTAFTSVKMKMMFNIMQQCASQLKDHLAVNCTEGPFEIKRTLDSYTVDVIGSTAFGLNCNSLADPSSDFCKYARRILNPTLYEAVKQVIAHVFPSAPKLFGVKVMPDDYTNFFTTMLKETVQYREKTGTNRNDFLQILINLMNNENTDEEQKAGTITLSELIAQSFFFFAAGYETSSNNMSCCLFELSRNPDLQEKVRAEVNEVFDKYNGAMTYEGLNDLKYMGAVLDETLRMYPPVVMLNRICTLDYKIPDSDLVIKKGTAVVIPSIGLHHDPEYYPEPEKFDPSRFVKKSRDNSVSPPYLPFGEGPRVCIGARFGTTNTKIGLSLLLKHFKFSLSDKTTLPIQFSPSTFLLSIQGGLWLNVERI